MITVSLSDITSECSILRTLPRSQNLGIKHPRPDLWHQYNGPRHSDPPAKTRLNFGHGRGYRLGTELSLWLTYGTLLIIIPAPWTEYRFDGPELWTGPWFVVANYGTPVAAIDMSISMSALNYRSHVSLKHNILNWLYEITTCWFHQSSLRSFSSNVVHALVFVLSCWTEIS